MFCGSDRGNFDFIKNEIEKNELNKLFTIIPFASHEEVIFFYENVFGVVMPTTGGPTNLPLYESFFFKKPIFYTKDLLNDENLKKAIIEIDIKDRNFVRFHFVNDFMYDNPVPIFYRFTRVLFDSQEFLYPPEPCSENPKKNLKNIKILKIFS